MEERRHNGELAGKVVLVTGGAKRIGRSIVEHVSMMGAAVAIHCNKSVDEAESLATDIKLSGGEAEVFQADFCDEDQRASLVNQLLANKMIEKYGGIHVLVNSASIYSKMPFEHCNPSKWSEIMNINAEAPYFLTQLLLPALRMNKGNIINIIDTSYARKEPFYSIYYASKAALGSLTKTLAIELAPDIRVNAVAPGAILPSDDETDMTEEIAKSIPLQRWGEPADISSAVVFLATSNYVTGQTITVDGGWSL